MAARIIDAPSTIAPPNHLQFGLGDDHKVYGDEIRRYVAEVVAWCKANTKSKSDLIGEEYRVPVVDGYAEYVVLDTKPLILVHLKTWDEYCMSEIHRRGLRLSDVQAAVDFRKVIE